MIAEGLLRGPQLPEAKDVIVGELAVPGAWITISVETSSFWTVQAQKVQFRGHTIWVLPIMAGYYPSVAMAVTPSMTDEEHQRLLMRFLSALSWSEGRGRGFLSAGVRRGSRPTPVPRMDPFGVSTCRDFQLVYLPEPTEERAILALALLREARGLKHSGYAFLSFYRVIEAAIPDGSKRGPWIEDRLIKLTDREALSAINKLKDSGTTDVGRHLYKSRRQAVAHASEGVIIDPDDLAQLWEVEADLPIISALAERAVEEVLGVETRWTVYDKHLYELAGFKQIIGDELIQILLGEEEMQEERNVEFPPMKIALRRSNPFAALASMDVHDLDRVGKQLHITLKSQSSSVFVRFHLDFEQERLVLEPKTGLFARDTDSAADADGIADLKEFFRDMYLNGELHIFNADTGALIARKEAFIPRNEMIELDVVNADIQKWRDEAELRRHPEKRVPHMLNTLAQRYPTTMNVNFSHPSRG